MAMAQVDGLVDGVLQAFQERLSAVEMNLADLRGELVLLRDDFEASRRDEIMLRSGQSTMERRLDRIERRVNSADLQTKQAP
jgi:hypothetical protein